MFCTCCTFPPHQGRAATDSCQSCLTERRREAHHCIDGTAEPRPGSREALRSGHDGNGEVTSVYCGDGVAQDCEFHRSAEVQVEGHDRGLSAGLSAEQFGSFGGRQFPPHGESSVQSD